MLETKKTSWKCTEPRKRHCFSSNFGERDLRRSETHLCSASRSLGLALNVIKVIFNKCLNLRSGLSLLLYVGEKWDRKMQCLCILIIRACHAAICQCVSHTLYLQTILHFKCQKMYTKLNNKHTVFLHSRSNRKICILKIENENTGKIAFFQNLYIKKYIPTFCIHFICRLGWNVCCSEFVTMHVGWLYVHP